MGWWAVKELLVMTKLAVRDRLLTEEISLVWDRLRPKTEMVSKNKLLTKDRVGG